MSELHRRRYTCQRTCIFHSCNNLINQEQFKYLKRTHITTVTQNVTYTISEWKLLNHVMNYCTLYISPLQLWPTANVMQIQHLKTSVLYPDGFSTPERTSPVLLLQQWWTSWQLLMERTWKRKPQRNTQRWLWQCFNNPRVQICALFKGSNYLQYNLAINVQLYAFIVPLP